MIASASNDKTVKLWKRDGTLINTLIGHLDLVNGVSFSHDGQMIASASDDRTVRLWKRDGTPIAILTGYEQGVFGLSFSPDDKTLATSSDDRRVILWNLTGLNLNSLLQESCSWLRDYLETNPNADRDDRQFCNSLPQSKD